VERAALKHPLIFQYGVLAVAESGPVILEQEGEECDLHVTAEEEATPNLRPRVRRSSVHLL